MKTGEEMFFTEGREDQEDREVEEWRGFEQKVAKEAKEEVTGEVNLKRQDAKVAKVAKSGVA